MSISQPISVWCEKKLVKNNLANLMTLCETCHDDIHKKGSKQKKVRTSKGQKIIEM